MVKYDLSLVGLGKLGLPLAICFASSKTKVLGIDKDAGKVHSLQKGFCPLYEPELKEKFKENRENFDASTKFSKAIEESNCTIILVNTPSRPDGGFSNQYVMTSLTEISDALSKSDKPMHHIIISSTIMPGSCEKDFIPLIERVSGRKLNEGFTLSYVPDLVALGTVIDDFHNPDLLILGSSSVSASNFVEALYNRMIRNGCPIKRLSLIEAEIAKISLNTFLTLKISFGNALSLLCNEFPSEHPVNVDNITNTIGLDKRIGSAYLKGGMPYGGACFPRDVWAFNKTFDDANLYTINFPQVMNEVNHSTYIQIHNHLRGHTPNCMAFLGGAFKPNTPVLEESPTINIIDKIIDSGYGARKIVVQDGVAFEEIRKRYLATPNVVVGTTPFVEEAINKSDYVVIMHNSKEYANVELYKNKTVIDPWRLLADQDTSGLKSYSAIGTNY